MSKNNKAILLNLQNHEQQFKAWLKENYTPQQIIEKRFDDAGYPYWNEIEHTFERLFKAIDFSTLSKTQLDSMIYLIARQWDIGIILNWFNKGNEDIGELGMTEHQLLVLASHGINSDEIDARATLAFSLYKLKNNKEQAIRLLLNYHQDQSEFTRRGALYSLHKLNYPIDLLEEMLEKSWAFDEEIERMVCLQLLQKIKSPKFNSYRAKALLDPRKDLRDFASKLDPN